MSDREEYKMWLAVRTDLKNCTVDGKDIPAGKLAVQSGHAFQLLTVQVLKHHPELMRLYMTDQSVVKIVVEADNEDHLLKIAEQCRTSKIPFSIIKDAGRTVFKGPTHTVVAFGPWLRSELPSKLKRLQLYKEKEEEDTKEKPVDKN